MTYQVGRDAPGDYQEPVSAQIARFPGMDEFTHNPCLPDHAQPLTAGIAAQPPWPDYMLVDNMVGGVLCSQRFVAVLQEANAEFYAYPVQISARTGEHHATQYFLWAPKQVTDAIDWERSEVWQDPDTRQRYLTTLAVTHAVLEQNIPVFRPTEIVTCLVAEGVRAKLEVSGITGIEFLPLDVVGNVADGEERAWLELRLRDDPENHSLWGQLGHVSWRLHHLRSALNAVDQAIQLRPDDADAWTLKGLVLREEGQLVEARQALAEAIRLDPINGPWDAYAAALRDGGQNEDALAAAYEGLNQSSHSPTLWYEMGAAHFALGNYEQALTAFSQALQPLPGRDEIWYLAQGDTLARLGRHKEAIIAFKRGIEVYPCHYMLWSHLSQSLRALKCSKQADEADEMAQQCAEELEENARRRPL